MINLSNVEFIKANIYLPVYSSTHWCICTFTSITLFFTRPPVPVTPTNTMLTWLIEKDYFPDTEVYPESKVHMANMAPCRPQLGPMLAPWTLLSVYIELASKLYIKFGLATGINLVSASIIHEMASITRLFIFLGVYYHISQYMLII